MTTYLFPPSAAPGSTRKRPTYITILADINRAACDAQEALGVFGKLLVDGHVNGTSGFSHFDAQVGDCGCQLRATMIREIFLSQKASVDLNPDPGFVPSWITDTISCLSTIEANSKAMCFKLTRDGVRPRELGLGDKFETPEAFVKLLSPNPKPSGSMFAVTLPDRWDANSPWVVTRFLVYCYTLSKYKRFHFKPIGLGCRLEYTLAAGRSDELIAPFWDHTDQRFATSTPRRIIGEFTPMQVWVSHLTCAWLKSWSHQLCVNSLHSRLLRASMQSSSKGIYSSACFPTFLLLRDMWARTNCQIILVDRHFCSKGFHYHVLLGTLKYSPARTGDLITPMNWCLRPITIQSLTQQSQDSTPHMVVTGNSIRGSSAVYLSRVLGEDKDSQSKRHPHEDDYCKEFLQHVSELEGSDHDLLTLAFFASHKSYAFPLEGSLSEHEFLESCLLGLGTRNTALFQQLWDHYRSEVDRLGVGTEDLRVFRWHHVFAETKHGVGKLLTRWIERNALMPQD